MSAPACRPEHSFPAYFGLQIPFSFVLPVWRPLRKQQIEAVENPTRRGRAALRATRIAEASVWVRLSPESDSRRILAIG